MSVDTRARRGQRTRAGQGGRLAGVETLHWLIAGASRRPSQSGHVFVHPASAALPLLPLLPRERPSLPRIRPRRRSRTRTMATPPGHCRFPQVGPKPAGHAAPCDLARACPSRNPRGPPLPPDRPPPPRTHPGTQHASTLLHSRTLFYTDSQRHSRTATHRPQPASICTEASARAPPGSCTMILARTHTCPSSPFRLHPDPARVCTTRGPCNRAHLARPGATPLHTEKANAAEPCLGGQTQMACWKLRRTL